MKLRGYTAILSIVLAASFSAAAQNPLQTVKTNEGCVPSGEKLAGNLGLAEAEFVPIRSTTGDLNADGRDEEIVLVRHIGKSGPRPDELLVYDVQGKDVRLLVRLEVGRPGEYVLSVKSLKSNFKVEGGRLFIDVAVMEDVKSEPPKRFRTVAYRWDGKALVEADRSEAKPLPEHMREIG